MKKFIILLLILSFSLMCLVGCIEKDEDMTIAFYVPDGAPALSVATLLADGTIEGGAVDVSIVTASEISSKVSTEQADMAILPVNTAASLYTSGEDYQLVAVNTFGLLYIVSASGAIALDDLVGEVLYCIGSSGVPQYVLEYLLVSNNIEYVESETAVAGKVALRYFTSGADIIPQLATGIVQYAMLGEPAATKAVTLGESNGVALELAIDLQEQWQDTTGSGSYGYPQAGLFVKSSLLEENSQLVASVCLRLLSNDDYLTDNVDSVAQLLEDNGSVDLAGTAFTAELLDRCNVGFAYASDVIGDISSFLQVLYDFNSNSVGGQLPDSDFIANIK